MLMMTSILTAKIPVESIYKKHISKIDFHDTFSVSLATADMPIEEIFLAVFSHTPAWIENLLKLRNAIVGVFGLKTEGNDQEVTIENVRIGESRGLFKIYDITDQEVIAGEDDKHLNFRVSVLKQNDKLFTSTFVQYNNLFGKMYMTIIMPFHKLIVKAMLRSAVRNKRI